MTKMFYFFFTFIHSFNIHKTSYNEEDDQLERYVENLLLEEKSKDLNVYPIMKAKQSLSLGRFATKSPGLLNGYIYSDTLEASH